MKVLLVGSGSREHALAWKLNRSDVVSELLVWPGSPAMESHGKVFPFEGSGWQELAQSAKNQDVGFIVVGPEQPLAEGFADACQELKIPVFGPRQGAAQLESSKEFAKDVMKAAKIPTAAYHVVSSFEECRSVALKMLEETGGAVIKASGLAAGKGVFVCTSSDDIDNGINRLSSSMAQAAERIVVEQILEGRECSFFCFVGQNQATPLGFAVDFKRLKDGDEGPNTGGMGCYTPVPWLPASAEQEVMDQVVNPLIKQLKAQDTEYTGFLYVGLMWSEQGPSVVEFNVRLGDPEAQVLAVNDVRDWGRIIAQQLKLVEEASIPALQADRKSVALVLAGEGYPYEKPSSPVPVLSSDLFDNDGTEKAVFGASIVKVGDQLKPGGGRVMTVVQSGDSFEQARKGVYARAQEITKDWSEVQYRQDIALRVSTEK